MSYAKPQKAIAFRGDAAQRNWAWPEDFRLWGNPDYIQQSGTRWVRFWVVPAYLQHNDPGASPPSTIFGEQISNVRTSWDHLNFAAVSDDYNPAWPNAREPLPYLAKLDRQIRAANNAGIFTILTVAANYPYWMTGTTAFQGTKSGEYHHPADLSPNGPWGWLIAHLCARYRLWSSFAYGTPPNPFGPHLSLYTSLGESSNPSYQIWFGNPAGAAINALEITNEPNSVLWPQVNPGADPTVPGNLLQGYVAAAMFYTAYAYGSAYGWPPLFGPATLDITGSSENAVGYHAFNECVTAFAAGYYNLPPSPSTYAFGFTQHNYGDVAHQIPWPDSRARDEDHHRPVPQLAANRLAHRGRLRSFERHRHCRHRRGDDAEGPR